MGTFNVTEAIQLVKGAASTVPPSGVDKLLPESRLMIMRKLLAKGEGVEGR